MPYLLLYELKVPPATVRIISEIICRSVHQIEFSQFRWQKIILFLTSWRRQIPSNSAKL